MIPKSLKLIVTFHTTTAAMAMEKFCKAQQIPGRLIPVPREISAGCGMSWCAPPEAKAAVKKAVADAGVEVDNFYELMV